MTSWHCSWSLDTKGDEFDGATGCLIIKAGNKDEAKRQAARQIAREKLGSVTQVSRVNVMASFHSK